MRPTLTPKEIGILGWLTKASDDWNSVVGGSDTSDAVSGVTVSGIAVVTPPPDAPPPVNSTVDGVTVQTSTTVNPSTGLAQKTILVPIVTSTRSDDSSTPHSALADIPLTAADTGGARTDLVVSLPTGTGFQAEGSSVLLSSSQALLDLINRIESKTPPGSPVQAELTGAGTSFLTQLASSTMLMSQSLTLTATQAGRRKPPPPWHASTARPVTARLSPRCSTPSPRAARTLLRGKV